jgi:hypothetical protein
MTWAMCWLILGAGLVPAFAHQAEEAQKQLQGTWTATEGALKGKAWKGIYALDGDTLTTCDNAPDLDKGRPAAFETKAGSGHIFITFQRAKP